MSAKTRLWRVFLQGRSLATGLLCLTLLLLNRFELDPSFIPLLLISGLQFASNAAYYYLWRNREIAVLSYLSFALEIILITLLIFNFGIDGHVFLLTYLWPIMMAGWLIGHHAILPLTLLSSVCYGALICLARSGVTVSRRFLMPDGTPQAWLLAMFYLAFNAFLLWTLTTEKEKNEERLRNYTRHVTQMNARLAALVELNEALLAQEQDLDHLVRQVVGSARSVIGTQRVGLYIREKDEFRLKWPHTLPQSLAANRERIAVPSRWLDRIEGAIRQHIRQERIVYRASGQRSSRSLLLIHIPLRATNYVRGMLTAVYDRDSIDEANFQLLQLLGHQIGAALENAKLVEDLRREGDLLNSILGHMSEAVFVVDANHRVALANAAARKLLNIYEGDVLPANLRQMDKLKDSLARTTWQLGDRTFSISRAMIYDTTQSVPSWIYVARDITEEAQIIQMKTDFVSYASHELRTPLATIKMLVRLLMNQPPADKQRQYLELINDQLERQTQLIQNLLDLARLEAGKYELPPESVDLDELLQTATEPFFLLAQKKGLTIRIHCQVKEPIISNRTGLEQVLSNLLSNAIKFTDTGGEVFVSCTEHGSMVRLQVRDTGIGMSREQMKRLFTKFYTASRDRRAEGTGLGLVISDMIVRALGGSIHVESELGKGSCFTVVLPRIKP